MLLPILPAQAQLEPGSLDNHWNAGALNCDKTPQPPLQFHRYNSHTFILRENPCTTFEAPFMYLLIGSNRSVLIDTGDAADGDLVPLAKTVMDLLPTSGSAKQPLLVVHTHRHLDHRAGDGQFVALPNVEVVGFDLESVRHFYHFNDWPNSVAQIGLGNRTVDVVPTPGHNETEVSFYDRQTGLVFTGDFLLPARILIDNTKDYLASAQRLISFLKNRPVIYLLGGHIEMNAQGKMFPWGSQYHPDEHVLEMTRNDLLAFPAALSHFNGFYTQSGQFTMSNSTHNLIAMAALASVLLISVVWIIARYIRHRRRQARKTLGEINFSHSASQRTN